MEPTFRIPGYPKVRAIGHAEILDLFDDPVVIEEKIDGSQFSFCKKDGALYARSRGRQIDVDAPEKMFSLAVETARNLLHKLTDGWIYRGEVLCKPKHNVLAYDRVPQGNVILYDVETGPSCFLKPLNKVMEADRLGLECVPSISVDVKDMNSFLLALETDSCLGGQKIEGFVAKNYNRFTADSKVKMGKYVSERFKEVHRKAWKMTTNKEICDEIGSKLRSEARWDKAVQHMAEAGKLEGTPRDIGILIEEVRKDVFEEEAELIKARLLKWAEKRIARHLTAGLPEWYKQQLAAKSFEEK